MMPRLHGPFTTSLKNRKGAGIRWSVSKTKLMINGTLTNVSADIVFDGLKEARETLGALKTRGTSKSMGAKLEVPLKDAYDLYPITGVAKQFSCHFLPT